MTKPDTDDGWLKYAHELDAALACADWSKGARIVLREVFTQLFGPAKRRVAYFSATELARRFGSTKQNILRSTRELIEGGALTRTDDHGFRFVKDYESWTKNGRPRLTPGEINGCQLAPSLAVWHKFALGGNSDTKGGNSDTPRVAIQTPKGGNSDTPRVAIQTPPPYSGSADVVLRLPEKGEKREGGKEPPPDLASLGKEYLRVGELATKLGGNESWAKWVCRQGIIGHPAAWIELALTTCPEGKFNRDWLAARLRAWKTEGGPPKPPKTQMNGPAKTESKPMTAEEIAADKDRKNRAWGTRPGGTK